MMVHLYIYIGEPASCNGIFKRSHISNGLSADPTSNLSSSLETVQMIAVSGVTNGPGT